ncbi:MAG: tRNA uridine-5-carboxymethylaminomethyl(34) synthesis enzyme MnmG, partial [Flavobacteriales bacterium]
SLVSRPQLGLNDLIQHVSSIQVLARDLELEDGDLECLEVEIKYSGYIEKEQAIADKLQRLDYVQIPENFRFEKLESLSSEAREKLAESQPKSLAEASRISGVSASDLAVLLVHLGR